MDGELHFRQTGRIRPPMPTPVVERPRLGRTLFGHAVPFGVLTRIEASNGKPAYNEWFARGSVRMMKPRVPFSLDHVSLGGRRVGWVVRLMETPTWLDFAAVIDEGPAGDALLEQLPGDAGRIGVSIAFDGISAVTYPEGIMRTRVALTEIAMVDTPAYEGAYLYSRGSLYSLAELEATAS